MVKNCSVIVFAVLGAAILSPSVFAVTARSYVQNGLIAQWDGVENAGYGVHVSSTNKWVDVVGGRAFTLYGATTVGDDRMTFAGATSSYGELSAADTTATFTAARNGTLEIVYRATSTAETQFMLQSSTGNSNNKSLTFSIWKTTSIIAASGTASAKSPIFTFTSGTATNLVAVRYSSGGTVNAVANGTPLVSPSDNYWGTDSTGKTFLGKRLSNASPFGGSIYCIRLYNRQLTDDEIAANQAIDSLRFIEHDASASATIRNVSLTHSRKDATVAAKFYLLQGSSASVSLWTGTSNDPNTFTQVGSAITATQSSSLSFPWTIPFDTRCWYQLRATVADDGSTVTTSPEEVFVPSYYLFTGAAGGDWHTAANWDAGMVPTSANGVVISKAVVASGSNALEAASLTINDGGSLTIGRKTMNDIHPELTVVGDLTMNGNATMTIYAGPTNEFRTFAMGGAKVTVGGTMSLNGTSQLLPWTHRSGASSTSGALDTGAPVVFDVGSFVLGANAKVDASEKGFTLYAFCPSRYNLVNSKLSAGTYFGGSHGGAGGRVSSTGVFLPAYDKLLAPLLPGYGGGNGRVGGGTIRIAAGTASIAGTLDATGQAGASSGGGGGGTIWITCGGISVAPTAFFKARGGNVGNHGYGTISGSGGGGRISVCVGLSAAQIESLYATGSAQGLATNDLASVFPGQVDVTAGYIRAKGLNLFTKGGEGSAVYATDATGKHGFSVENEPPFSATLSPALGVYAYSAGQEVVASATTPASSGDGARRVCTGWEIRSDATGEVLAQGNGASLSGYNMPAESVTLVWKWETVQYRLSASAYDGGTVNVSEDWCDAGGPFAAVTAAAASGYEFQYWTGDVPSADRCANPLVLSADQARSVKAFFGRTEGASYTMSKSNNSTVYDWHTASNWTPAGVPGTNDTAIIAYSSGNYKLFKIASYAKVGALTVSGSSAYLRVGSTVSTVTSRAIMDHTPASSSGETGLEVVGDLSVANGAWLGVGGNLQKHRATLAVGGDLTIGNGAGVGIAAASTNTVSDSLYDATSDLAVGGTLTVENGGHLYPGSHVRTGGSVLISANNVVIEAGGEINANGLGYYQYAENTEYVFPWPGAFDNRRNVYVGGAHGGKGGDAKDNSWVGNVFGCANGPVHPGTPGGNTGSGGGGVIRLSADTILLTGTLTAKGNNGGTYGGGSGGSIYVIAGTTFTADPASTISVRGGDITRNSSGGGGGGRAAVCVGLTAEQLVAVRGSDEVEGIRYSDLGDVVPGFTAAGGLKSSYTSASPGQDGTGVYLLNTAGSIVLNVTGEPEAMGVVNPAYGTATQPSGRAIALEAPVSVYVPNSGEKSRRICHGYVVTNALDEVVASGATSTGTVTFASTETECWLTWDWTRLEHRLTLATDGGGHISTTSVENASSEWQGAGTTVSLVAVPDSGWVFAGWSGHAAGAIDRTAASLSFTMDRPCALTACFAPAAPGQKTWNGGTGRWDVGANWTPEGIPGPAEDVFVNSGKPIIDTGFAVTMGSLAIAKGAQVVATNSEASASDTIGLAVAGSLWLNGSLTIGYNGQGAKSALSVGGDLFATNGQYSALTVYAGPLDDPERASCYHEGGGEVTAGGLILIGSNSTARVLCHGMTGAPIVFRSHRFRLESGGVVNASIAGYTWSVSGGRRYGYAPGSPPLARYADYDGGSYGGLGSPNGGWGSSALCTATYGKDFAPYMPGSPGGNHGDTGGGAIRIDAGRCEIFGTLNANGGISSYGGGGSGGGIWVTCRRYASADTARISANGGAPGATSTSGGGGGGRICVLVGATGEKVAPLYEAEALPASFSLVDLKDAEARAATPVAGEVSVDGGSKSTFPNNSGRPGTAVYVVAPRDATFIMLR